jgi:hypothetical protein
VYETCLVAFVPRAYLNVSLATLGSNFGGIQGTIVDNGTKAAVAGVQVWTWLLENRSLVSTMSDASGGYAFHALLPMHETEAYQLLFVKQGYMISSSSVAVSSNVTSRQDVQLMPLGKGFSLSGFLMDESGGLIPYAYIYLYRGDVLVSSEVKANGVYGGGMMLVSGLPSVFRLHITADGYRPLEDNVTIYAGSALYRSYVLKSGSLFFS